MSTQLSKLDISTTEQTKQIIENAANFLGVTTSAFVIQCAMEQAQTVLAQNIHLNRSESERFLALLENPPKPNEHLKRLFSSTSSLHQAHASCSQT